MADILSLIALAGIISGCLWQGVVAFRLPTEYSTLEKFLYAPVYCFGRLLWRIEIVQGVPVKGPAERGVKNRRADLGVSGAVLVSNHRNSLDPFFLQLACGRRVHWLVAGEYFKSPVFGPVLRTFQAIPTNRSGSDSASLKTAIRLASEGRLVGMFPEGRINRSLNPLLKIRAGAGMVASKANCPLLPCWIEGAPRGWDVWSGWFMSAHIRIFIGKPIFIDAESNHDWTNEHIAQDCETDRHTCIDGFTATAMKQSLKMAGHGDWPVELARKRLNQVKANT